MRSNKLWTGTILGALIGSGLGFFALEFFFLFWPRPYAASLPIPLVFLALAAVLGFACWPLAYALADRLPRRPLKLTYSLVSLAAVAALIWAFRSDPWQLDFDW